MGHIRQNLNPILTQPTLTWRQDGALDTPELVGPRNESYFCPPDADLSDYPVGGNSGAKLKWKAVSEASFYVVQWCICAKNWYPSIGFILSVSQVWLGANANEPVTWL